MLNPTLSYRTAVISCTATTNQTLPENAVLIVNAYYLNGNATAGLPITGQKLTVVTAAPSAGQIQFTGTPQSPSNTVTLSAAPTAGMQLAVQYVPQGALPAAA